ncbi:MAG: DUF6454 family protein [Acidobacteriota bacterium]
MTGRRLAPRLIACTFAALAALPIAAGGAGSTLTDAVMRLTRASRWTAVASVPLAFPTFHPQGLVRIGDTFVVSSVEVTVPPRRFETMVDGYDRDPGQGVGHLFKFDKAGTLIGELRLGEGTIYHPGGLDYDGRDIWVAVSEYRPDSRAIVYRVDPVAMRATEVFRFADHLGALVHDTDSRTLHGVSWGSRRFYRWTLDRRGRVSNAAAPPAALRRLNPSHYVDYQDCKYAGRQRMLCTGVAELRQSPEAPAFRLGGMDLVDLRDGRPLHQVPILLWTKAGLDMTHNPVWIEPHGPGLRGYFLPDDNASTLYIYDVDVP